LKSSFRKNLKAEDRGRIAAAIARIPKSPDQPPDPGVSVTATPHKKGIHFGPENGPQTPFGAWLEKQVKDKIGEDGSKAKLFADTLRSNIPAMMLCCIPLFAFVLKILYLRKRRFYVEHLV